MSRRYDEIDHTIAMIDKIIAIIEKEKKIRLGKVYFSMKYVVDLENKSMVSEAKDCLLEDINSAIKYDELHLYIDTIEDESLSEGDIPDFLKELEEE